MLNLFKKHALKAEYEEAQELITTSKQAVASGAITPQEAQLELVETLGAGYEQRLEQQQALLREDSRKKAFFFSGILFGVLLSVLFIGPQLTGFAVFSAPNTLIVEQSFTESTTFLPGITQNITGLRVTGEYVGSGDMRIIYVTSEGEELLVRESTAPRSDNQTLVLGQGTNRTTRFRGQCEETCSLNATAPHRLRIEVTEGELYLESITYSVPIHVQVQEEEVVDEPTPSNETEEEILEEEEPTQEEVVIPETPSNETNTTTPENNTTLPEEELITPEINETNTTEPTQEEGVVDEPTPSNETEEEILEEEEPITEPVEEQPTQPITEPEEETIPAIQLASAGTQCNSNNDCASGVCKSNLYEGEEQTRICAETRTQCVANQELYNQGETRNNNVCVASSQNSIWLSQQSRFEIRAQQLLLIADKYGNLAIRGNLREGESTNRLGWRSEEVTLEETTGDLYLPGTLQEKTTPQGSGRAIQNQQGITQVLFSNNLQLRGEFLAEANMN